MKQFLSGYTEFGRALSYYREYLKQSVGRDLKRRYKRSSLGYVWSMLNPLFMMIILTVVFSKLMRIQIEYYAVHLFAALLPWQYFQQTLMGSLDSVRKNIRIIDHVPIPKYIFAVSVAFSNLVNLVLAVVPLLLVMLVVGCPISPFILLMPLILVPLFLTSLGLALILSASNVFFDDTRHLVEVGLRALFYLSPVIYGSAHLPQNYIAWLKLNPMFHVIELMRSVVYYGRFFDLSTFAILTGVSVLILGIGLFVFKKADSKFLYFV